MFQADEVRPTAGAGARINSRRHGRLQSLDEALAVLHGAVPPVEAGRTLGLPAITHAVQTATLARRCGACDALVTAALLHDVGRQAHAAESASARQVQAELGAELLAELFPAARFILPHFGGGAALAVMVSLLAGPGFGIVVGALGGPLLGLAVPAKQAARP